jgi:hypothetical protein
MCPPFSPPGFFDLAAQHTPIIFWMWGLMVPLLIPVAFWSFHYRHRHVPPGQARRTLAWLYSIQCGFLFGGIALLGLTSLWEDAITRWFNSVPDNCYVGIQRIDYFDQLSGIEGTLLGCSLLLVIVGSLFGVLTNRRFQQARAAMRQGLP